MTWFKGANGESGADVYDRVSTWLESLHRELEYGVAMSADSTVLLVTHGLTARLFLMRWYRWSVDTFETTENLCNAGMLVMERDALGRLLGYCVARNLHVPLPLQLPLFLH